MAKLYTEHLPQPSKKMSPKKETVDFLLNYSRALKISSYNKLQFKSILN
jgi:hypothetical protein